nr:MAG TPA: 4Fe-4S dicluster domain protein [Caudoviricetes sp.]
MSVTTIGVIVALWCNAATALVLLQVQAQLRDLRKAWARIEASDLDHGLRLTVAEKNVKDLRRGARELSTVVGMIDRDVQELNDGKYPGSAGDHEARCLGCSACVRGDCS